MIRKNYILPLLCACTLAACGKKSPETAAAAAPPPATAQAPAAPTASSPGGALTVEIAATDPITEEQVIQISKEFTEVIQRNEALIKQGLLDDPAAAVLEKLGPEDTAAAANLMVAGNILYRLSPKDSLRLHQKALEREPGSKLTNIEAAYEYQRAGKYPEACNLWKRVLSVEPDHIVAKALQAHCLLYSGEEKAALDSWRGLNMEALSNITAAVSEVFGVPHPLAKRKELLDEATVATDQDAAASRLILHDLEWKLDWWNSRPNMQQAETDLHRFTDKLTEDTKYTLSLLIRLYRAEAGNRGLTAEGARSLRAALKHKGQEDSMAKAVSLAGIPYGGLPKKDVQRLGTVLSKNSGKVRTPILSQLTAFADKNSLFTKDKMLEWLRPTLEARMAAAGNGAEDALLLGWLASESDGALARRTYADCAERFDDKECVVMTLASLREEKKLTLENLLLQNTMKAHPDWVHPHMFALKLAVKGSPEERTLLRRTILAEFHELEYGSVFMPRHTATGLFGLFKALAETTP